MEVGDKLNPQRSYRKGFALKGLHHHIIKTNNPSTIGPDELLTVRFPDLKENQVIIPSTTKLTFNISLAGTDVNRTLVGNLGRNIIRKLVVKLEGNGNKADVANDITVASIYDNRFCIPLDFEILESRLPLYQYGLGSHLTYELTFANYSNVIKSMDQA